MSRIAGSVHAIERHRALGEAARARLAALGYDNVTIRIGDGSVGWPQAGPFDAIVAAAFDRFANRRVALLGEASHGTGEFYRARRRPSIGEIPMQTSYKPDGYPSAAPYLVVTGAQRLADFLVTVFAAEPLRMVPGDGGRLRHGEVRIDDTVVMLADALEGWPAVASHVHVYVPDVDATFRRAIEAGAEPVQQPARKDDADRRGGFRGPGGITWWVATQQGA